MLEKDIENLIARHPEEFFPQLEFSLLGQQYRVGSCYIDVLFKDREDKFVIIEIKRGILTREAVGQIVEYYGLLKQENPGKLIELILCANFIPSERKAFLENVGIKFKELGVSLITDVASKHGYKFIDDDHKLFSRDLAESVKEVSGEKKVGGSSSNSSTWVFQANPQRYDVVNFLSDFGFRGTMTWTVNQHKDKIHKGDTALIWMSGEESGIYAITEVVTEPAFIDSIDPLEEKYWIDVAERNKKRFMVKLNIHRILLNRPIFRIALKNIAELKNLSILNQAQGTNFFVQPSEWEIIQTLIPVGK